MNRIALLILILTLTVIPIVALAQQSGLVNCGQYYVKVNDQQVIQGKPCTIQDAINLAISVINVCVQLSAMVAVLLIMWGAFHMIDAGTYANPELYKNAKVEIWHAIFGLCIILAAYVIINSIISLIFGNVVGGTTWFKPWQ